ncbi:MAG: Hpt domain-containing protein [Novosphingobium sp.]
MSYPLNGVAAATSYAAIAGTDPPFSIHQRFRAKAERYRQLLSHALAFRDADQIARLAHAFAGCGAMFGYPAVSLAAGRLEAEMGRRGRRQWDAIAASGAELVRILESISHESCG